MPDTGSDLGPQIHWYEGKKCHVCQHSSACSLSPPGSEIFHMQSNYAHITGLMPELHNFQFADNYFSAGL